MTLAKLPIWASELIEQQRVARPPAGPLLRLDVERAVCWRAADYDE